MIKLTGMIRKHVMNDLRPYVCTLPLCSQAGATYASRSAFLDHELSSHGDSYDLEIGKLSCHRKCVFCGEVLLEDEWEERVRHVGRHMEEIAFTVVTRIYEDWEFYSDASSSKFRCTGTTC